MFSAKKQVILKAIPPLDILDKKAVNGHTIVLT
jgi:hypothetical protein